MTMTQTAANPSLVNRLVGLLGAPSRRWQASTVPCANPDCKRRSAQHPFARRLNGVEAAGQWFCSSDCYGPALSCHFTRLVTGRKKITPARKARIPLGLMFLSRGELTQTQLNAALEEHRATGVRVGDVLLRENFVSEEQIAAALAAQWGHPTFPSNSAVAWLPVEIPTHLVKQHRIVPLHFVAASRTLLLGFADGPDHRLLSVLQRMLNCSVDPCFVTMSEYRRRCQLLKPEKRWNEVVFDQVCPPAEMARITASYISQLGSPRAIDSLCGEHLWVRLTGRKQDVDLLFRYHSRA
jgi:hypothetical protein